MDIKELKRLWRINNPNKVREQRRRYYNKHKEKMRQYSRTYKRKKYDQRVNGIKSWNRRMRIFGEISGLEKIRCVKCGNTDPRILQIHHVNGDGNRDVNFYSKFDNYLKGKSKSKKPTEKLELRCANCNILAEYEMGKRFPWLDRIDEDGNAVWKEILKDENKTGF